MFGISMRFQIAAIAFVAILLIDYARQRKPPLASVRCFTLMLVFSCINLAFDIATVWTLSHPETVPMWVNRLCHQIFIGSLDAVIYLLFLYVIILGMDRRRVHSLTLVLSAIPFLTSLGFVFFGQLHYYFDGRSGYSFGPMAYTVYMSVGVYMVSIMVYLLVNRKRFVKRTLIGILVGEWIWIVAAIVQLCNPTLLISGIALALMIFYIYLSFENPKEHLEAQSSCFNRRAFHLTLSETLDGRTPFFVVNLVLEDLNRISEEGGYATAANLLRLISTELAQEYDLTPYHYRWNSLVVLVHGQDEAEMRARIEPILQRFRHRWVLDDAKHRIRCHADVLTCPEFATSPDELYGLLDFKYMQRGAHGLCMIDQADVNCCKRRSALEKLLADAIAHDGLNVVYQPIFSAADNGFVSAEALVRLKDTQTLGFVSPDEFIPLAEQKGCIVELGMAVLEQVCRFASTHRLWEKGIKYIEVNLSGAQASDMELPAQIRSVLNRYGLPPAFINFEITESAAVESGDGMRANMKHLRDMGCSFSMDDFGTGYSNLSQMAATDYDLIKLDKSLIWPCFGDLPEQPTVILHGMIEMILKLNTQLVAEGVETQAQADHLIRLGVNYLQGYLFSKPLTSDDYLAFMKNHPIKEGI